MKALILSSNWRARVALVLIKIAGRSSEHMAELRDALNQRRAMRATAHYSIWRLFNEAKLRADWNRFCARYPFRVGSGDDEKDFNGFCLSEYATKPEGQHSGQKIKVP